MPLSPFFLWDDYPHVSRITPGALRDDDVVPGSRKGLARSFASCGRISLSRARTITAVYSQGGVEFMLVGRPFLNSAVFGHCAGGNMKSQSKAGAKAVDDRTGLTEPQAIGLLDSRNAPF